MFTNVRWNEKTDVIIVCFNPNEKTEMIVCLKNEMKRHPNCLFPNIRWNEKNDVIIVCFPMLGKMKRMTT